jgi:Acyl-CoA dehydrogenases
MQRNVLADLALESEAAMLGALRVARATDGMETSEHERLLARVATPVVKFWNCQRAPAFSYECLQVHGGNGFIMENAMARLYREAPLNSIWEGTSNMMCMDVLRAMQRDARCRDAFIDELRASRGLRPDLRQVHGRSRRSIACTLPGRGHARALVTRMAHALQAAEMLQHGDADAADLFVRSRLGMDGMHVFGALPSSEGLARIVERASVIRH